MAIDLGARVGPYEVTALLGEGGMGKVWRGHHAVLRRDDALKVLPDAFAEDPDRLERFEREAQVLASLNHPNIAHIYGLEQGGSGRAIVMELVEGPTLAGRIALGPISPGETLSIARQIADALEAAHEKGVIHRDLKPGNIKVRPDGTVKVLDFGLAKVIESAGGGAPPLSQSPTITSPALTRQGVILGTAAYMSPEQASGAHVDSRSDIWAFGCVLYEMLTGKAPFAGDSVARVLAKILEREPDFAALPEGTPRRMTRLIRRCLEKDPRRRIHHIADARLELEDAVENDRPSAAAPVAPPARRVLLPWVVGSLVLGAAAMYAIAGGRGSSASRSQPVVRSTVATLLPAVPAAITSGGGPALSHDGRRIVYAAGGVLYVRSLEELESQPVRGVTAAAWPALSPDGESVAFFDVSASAIKRSLLRGGGALTIARTDGGTPSGLSWGPDDVIVFATDTSDGLWRVAATGGEPQRLTTVVASEAIAHQAPSVLPNGRGVLFEAFRGASSRIGVVSLETGEVSYPVAIGKNPRYAATGHLLYVDDDGLRAMGFDATRLAASSESRIVVEGVRSGTGTFDVASNGSLVYIPADAETRRLFVWVNRDGGEEPLDVPARNYTTARVSPDGNRIVADFSEGGQPQSVWVSDVRRPGWSRIPTPEHDGGDWFPKWSRDGRRVLFAVFGSRAPGLFWTLADGTGKIESLLTIDDNAFIDAQGWTPDGRSLLFTYGNPSESRIGLLTIPGDDGMPQWRPLVERVGGAVAGPVSPDGRWLITESFDSEGPSVYIERFPDLGDRQRVSAEGGARNAVWSPDGRELFYRRSSDGATMAVRIETTPRLSIGVPTVLFENRGYQVSGSRPWDVAPDGRFLMIKNAPQAAAGPAELVLVQNWFEDLKRLTGATR